MITKNDILQATHHGLDIFSNILGRYYPVQVVLQQVGNECKPTRNPFNNDKETLLISLQDDVFCCRDAELDQFKGTAFDFAANFYGLQGDKLLEKINLELKLHLASEMDDSFNSQDSNTSIKKDMPGISFFYCPISNTVPYVTIDPLAIFKVVGGTRYKPRTQRLRSINDPVEAAKFKRNNFDYVTFAGEFSRRSDKALIQPSGLMVFDFDKVKDPSLLKKTLIGNRSFFTVLAFISPSGIGLKWIIRVDLTQGTHEEWFTAVANYVEANLQEKVDRSGKDVSRACFLCHDPEVYINPIYLDCTD